MTICMCRRRHSSQRGQGCGRRRRDIRASASRPTVPPRGMQRVREQQFRTRRCGGEREPHFAISGVRFEPEIWRCCFTHHFVPVRSQTQRLLFSEELQTRHRAPELFLTRRAHRVPESRDDSCCTPLASTDCQPRRFGAQQRSRVLNWTAEAGP